ncbi:MAG TPA: response regulator [Verrucomicrobiae bacterium]|nr:response regulator [Verrucomicrobiae bacterium]
MSEPTKKHSSGAKDSPALIYVVDDEPMLLELAAVILEPQGYKVKTFRDPELALQAYGSASPKPDLLITDYAMHKLNGMEMIESFRKIDPRQKIILVSGTVGEYIFQDLPIKPDRFLAKPYQASQLSAIVKEVLAL